VTFCFTMDLVAWYHLHAMENSSFAPWAREMTSMVNEEKFHASFGARRVRDLVSDTRISARADPSARLVVPPANAAARSSSPC